MSYSQMLDDKARAFISRIQANFPIEHAPYERLAQDLDLKSADHAFKLMQELKERGVVRRLGAIFDSAHLGYQSSLCALCVDREADVGRVAGIISVSHAVTHNYLRPGHYNLWFTVTMQTEQDILRFLEHIGNQTGYNDYLYLPATRLYKIRVNFDMGNASSAEHAQIQRLSLLHEIQVEPYSDFDKALVRLLQEDISEYQQPYEKLAELLSQAQPSYFECPVHEDVVLQRLRNWKFNGVIRRFGAALHHRRIGFTHNAMVVWDIPDEQADICGALMAQQKEVSHCYARPRRATWPYNLYSMVHANSEGACQEVVARIVTAAAKEGIDIYPAMLLYSTREFKKVSMRYFLEELA